MPVKNRRFTRSQPRVTIFSRDINSNNGIRKPIKIKMRSRVLGAKGSLYCFRNLPLTVRSLNAVFGKESAFEFGRRVVPQTAEGTFFVVAKHPGPVNVAHIA